MSATQPPTRPSATRRSRRDRGTVLPLVLVVIVISALIVVPVLQYAVTVYRAGRVQSDRARDDEYARAGLRTALVSTEALYDACGDFAGDAPATLHAGLPGVSSTCRVLATANYLEPSEVPYHLATLQIGQPVPPEFASPFNYVNPSTAPDQEDAWQADRNPDRASGTLWLPNLPARPDTARTTPVRADGDYSRPMLFGECDVYFPGTYREPVVVEGPRPTYFVSGVYYFESTLTFRDGADAVIGDGENEGCTSDIDALNYVSNPPAATLISGIGGTFVFGGDGRLVVDNSTGGPVSVVFNRRFVDPSEEGALPSDGVSIMTVNGDLDDGNPTGDVAPLFVDDILAVPAGTVTTAGEIVSVGADGYVPSSHTPEPLPADAPASPAAWEYRNGACTNVPSCAAVGAAFVSWSAPADNGAPITTYLLEQRERPGTGSGSWSAWQPAACTIDPPSEPGAPLATSCTVTGLNGYGGTSGNARQYQFRVIAVNAGGPSDPSPESVVVNPRGRSGGGQSPPLAAPAPLQVTNDLGSPATNYANGKLVSWPEPVAPTATGGLRVTGYRVVATPTAPNPLGHPTVECQSTWDRRQCLLPLDDPTTPLTFEGLVALRGYDVSVLVTNAVGQSTPSPRSFVVFDPGVGSWPIYTPPAYPPPASSLRVPDAIVDVQAGNGAPIDFVVGGYVSVPQGRILLDGGVAPGQHTIELLGGAVAARIDVANIGSDMDVRLDNPATQKTILVTTTVDGAPGAEAVVQVNSNFGWALNSWQTN